MTNWRQFLFDINVGIFQKHRGAKLQTKTVRTLEVSTRWHLWSRTITDGEPLDTAIHRNFSPWPSMDMKISKTGNESVKPMHFGIYVSMHHRWEPEASIRSEWKHIFFAKRKSLDFFKKNDETTSRLIMQSSEGLKTSKCFRGGNSSSMPNENKS